MKCPKCGGNLRTLKWYDNSLPRKYRTLSKFIYCPTDDAIYNVELQELV